MRPSCRTRPTIPGVRPAGRDRPGRARGRSPPAGPPRAPRMRAIDGRVPTTTAVSSRPDATCAAAVELAAAAARAEAGDGAGEHLGVRAEGDRVVTHFFAATVPGYTGWRWAVTVARASRSRLVTVDEVVLLPGDGALLAPEWVPWSERLRPGDLGVGDLLPTAADDDRLVPAYLLSDDPAGGERRLRAGPGPAPGDVPARPGRGRRAVVRRGRRPGHPDGRARPGALRHLRLLPADRRVAAGGLRRLRQRVLAAGRRGGLRRLRLRRALRGAGRAAADRRPRRPRRTTTPCSTSSSTRSRTTRSPSRSATAERAGPLRHRRRPGPGGRGLGRVAGPVPGGRERRGGPHPRRVPGPAAGRAGAERGGRGGPGRRAGRAAAVAAGRRAARGQHRRARWTPPAWRRWRRCAPRRSGTAAASAGSASASRRC